MKLTGTQCVQFCAGYVRLEEITLDNDRGMAAAELYAAVLPKAQAYQSRQQALFKERDGIVKRYAQKNEKGEVTYTNPNDPNPNNRLVVWDNREQADAAFDIWREKAEALDKRVILIAAEPLPADFFAKPEPLQVVQSVRTAFMPLMANWKEPVQEEENDG